MKILITGIDGFIGTAIAKKLIADGHEVIGMSNGLGNEFPPLKKGVRGILYVIHQTPFAKGKSSPYKFHKVDIADSQAVFSVFKRERPDLTIHLAAMAHADVGPDKEALVRRVNVLGSLNVADAAEMYGGGKMLFFSSVKVLAETTGRDGIDEDSKPAPQGVYACLKREVEVELLKRTGEGRIAATIVRPAAVIGPGDSKGNYAKVLRAVQRGFFPLIDGGRVKRSVVFLERLAERVRVMVEKGIAPGEVFTLCDGAFSLCEVVDAMRISEGYAWCPSLPSAAIDKAVKLGDSLFTFFYAPRYALLLGNAKTDHAPFCKSLTRLTADFVVNTHRWDKRYGALPDVNLLDEIRKAACSAPPPRPQGPRSEIATSSLSPKGY